MTFFRHLPIALVMFSTPTLAAGVQNLDALERKFGKVQDIVNMPLVVMMELHGVNLSMTPVFLTQDAKQVC